MNLFEEELDQDENTLYVGVNGYSTQEFDADEAEDILNDAFDQIEDEYIKTGEYDEIVVVSGLTNMGIPKIAYEVADERDYKTSGIAPEEAREHDLYDVDEFQIIGKKFGDESQFFIDHIDVLVSIGGGEQTKHELEMAEDDGDVSVIEYDL